MTKTFWSNCLFTAIYLLLRDKRSRCVVVRSELKYSIHIVVITKNSHVVHFQHRDSKPKSLPFWFDGNIAGIPKSKLLATDIKDILWFSKSNTTSLLLLFSVGFVLSIPWLMGWLLYTPFLTARWICKGFFKRR